MAQYYRKAILKKLNEMKERLLIDEENENRRKEFLAYIQYLIDNPAPNRNIHDFESEE